MEGGESPLDVLSRAATMVQENQQAAEESAKQQQSNKQLPTTKWKRDRRSRLPEYSRKSDPKLPENWDPQQPPSPESNNSQSNGHNGTNNILNGNSGESCNAPLDMSVRQRGQPPSYLQTVNNPGYRSNYRPSVIQNRDDLPPGISMCDPIIDEHFRRSLGNDYLALFSNNNISKEIPKTINKSPPPVPKAPPPPLPPPPPPLSSTEKNVIELMDSEGLSVDDHFAKALGDTWTKLNKKDAEIKTNTTENLVSI